ncbi:hypothetical protein D3C85_1654240 [compost metagenome]
MGLTFSVPGQSVHLVEEAFPRRGGLAIHELWQCLATVCCSPCDNGLVDDSSRFFAVGNGAIGQRLEHPVAGVLLSCSFLLEMHERQLEEADEL